MYMYTRDQGQDWSMQTSCSVNNMFIIWQKQEQFKSFIVTDFWNGDSLNLISPKFAPARYFFSWSAFWHLQK